MVANLLVEFIKNGYPHATGNVATSTNQNWGYIDINYLIQAPINEITPAVNSYKYET